MKVFDGKRRMNACSLCTSELSLIKPTETNLAKTTDRCLPAGQPVRRNNPWGVGGRDSSCFPAANDLDGLGGAVGPAAHCGCDLVLAHEDVPSAEEGVGHLRKLEGCSFSFSVLVLRDLNRGQPDTQGYVG